MTKQMIYGQPLVYNESAPTFLTGEGGAFQCDVNGNLKITNATGLNKDDDSIDSYTKAGTPTNGTQAASIQFLAAPGRLIGFYVNSTNAGTIVIKNGLTTAGTAISGTITPAIGYHAYPAALSVGGFADLGGTGINVTFFAIAD